MADVFLSYSSKDRAAAQKVQEALAARGIDVFWDQATPPGQDWDKWIRGKLAGCKVAIVLWSRESVKSDNVRHEALVARKAKKLLPAMIDSIPAEDLPMGLYVVQATSLTDWRNPESAGMARLVAEVEARVGSRSSGATSAAPTTAAQSPRKINWAVAAAGVILVALSVGITQWIYAPQTPPASPGLTSLPCSNNLPRLSTGECPAFDPSRVLTPAAACIDGSNPVDGVCANGNRPVPPAPALGGGSATAHSLAPELQGHWTWLGQECRDGPNVSLVDGHLHFTAGSTRYVHAIESDSGAEVLTHVIEPASEAGDRYSLSPEYFATDERRSFSLIVLNLTDNTKNVWTPCEP